MRELERMFPRHGDRKGSTMTATTRRAALTALASTSALAVPSALIAPAATASLASISPELRAAIDAHRLAQANVDAQSSEQEEEFSALCDLEGKAWWKLAETHCATDAAFIAKIAYLLRHEQRPLGRDPSYTRWPVWRTGVRGGAPFGGAGRMGGLLRQRFGTIRLTPSAAVAVTAAGTSPVRGTPAGASFSRSMDRPSGRLGARFV
jgi:hypothetical protein